MRATPRYGGPPVIDVAEMGFDPGPVVQQRDRLLQVAAQLSDEQWAAPSRCAQWSIQDVVLHLDIVNRFWTASIAAGLRGEPTTMLARFDPVSVPAAMVAEVRGVAPPESLDRFAASNARLAGLLTSMSDADLRKPAEAPPGHLAIDAVCAHALWDGWVHERDILEPLGGEQVADADEMAMALAYVAALGPACYLNAGAARVGVLAVRAHEPTLHFVVDVNAQAVARPAGDRQPTASIQGTATELIESLSGRRPSPPVEPDGQWLVDGLLTVAGFGPE